MNDQSHDPVKRLARTIVLLQVALAVVWLAGPSWVRSPIGWSANLAPTTAQPCTPGTVRRLPDGGVVHCR